ncbi:group I intron-associated PD-(D/E)XK endonuclease [Sulfurifustis variabilis]
MHPKTTGDITEAAVLTALLQAGKAVLRPFSENHRYDLAIDEGDGRISRVQCKTGRLKDGAIEFKTCSSQAHRGKGTRAYHGDIEYFGVYCPETGRSYLVPVTACQTTRVAKLRVEPPKNGQTKGVRPAADFEL